jgi:hypothetical protein
MEDRLAACRSAAPSGDAITAAWRAKPANGLLTNDAALSGYGAYVTVV